MSSSPEHHPLEHTPSERQADWEFNAETRARVQAGINQYGEDPFLAFLTLPNTDLHDRELLRDFKNLYLGTFRSMRRLCDWWLETGNWQTGLANYVRVRTDDPSRLSIDYQAVESDIRQEFRVVKMGAGVHGFIRVD